MHPVQPEAVEHGQPDADPPFGDDTPVRAPIRRGRGLPRQRATPRRREHPVRPEWDPLPTDPDDGALDGWDVYRDFEARVLASTPGGFGDCEGTPGCPTPEKHRGAVAHHRHGRGAGGSNHTLNGAWLCRPGHRWVHEHPSLARDLDLYRSRSDPWPPRRRGLDTPPGRREDEPVGSTADTKLRRTSMGASERAGSLPDRTSNRLTDDDVAAIRRRIHETVTQWDHDRQRLSMPYPAASRETLVRVGLGAIGCGHADMRGVELDAVDAIAREALERP